MSDLDGASFDDEIHLLTPADIIFSMLERQAREGNFGINDGQIWRKPEWTDAEINEYIERLKSLSAQKDKQ